MLAIHTDDSEDAVPLSIDRPAEEPGEGLQGLRDVHGVRLEVVVARAGLRAFARSPSITRSHSTTFPARGTNWPPSLRR